MSNKPRLLDLFCGAGGAAVGYEAAGFEITGVDNKMQFNYPFPIILHDALELARLDYYLYDAIHASPPCQLFSPMNAPHKSTTDHPNLIPATREVLEATGLPYVIENVMQAPMRHDLVLCGQMFDINVIRHRAFETNFTIPQPEHVEHCNAVPSHSSRDTEWKWAAGVGWMTNMEARQAIPPEYTHYIGKYLMQAIRSK